MARLFPDGFTWGVATSAYQIEGGRTGRMGESIWDRFLREQGLPDTGEVACDHHRRWQEDVELMAGLGVDAYRFSISWPRVIPEGTGEAASEGLDFYRRLVDGLLERGIEPWATLYHWDLPQPLQERGGWASRGIVEAFLRYTETVTGALGDRVKHWITHNEPWVTAVLGYVEGRFAPGVRDWRAGLAAGHHILLSHGRAVPLIRERSAGSRVGIALDCRPASPASEAPADVEAHRHFDGFRNRWFFDPVFGRGYPEDVVADHRERGRIGASGLDVVRPGDLDEVAAPIDFLGLNYYTSLEVRAGADEEDDSGVQPGPDPPPGHTEMGWRNTPAALTSFLRRIRDEYGPAEVVITENGASYSDSPDDRDRVADERRIDYLEQHLAACHEAIEAGVPLTGYFVWSLLDNLEWTSGFSQRFGLVWVDLPGGRRVPKASYWWYRDVIARNGLTVGGPDAGQPPPG